MPYKENSLFMSICPGIRRSIRAVCPSSEIPCNGTSPRSMILPSCETNSLIFSPSFHRATVTSPALSLSKYALVGASDDCILRVTMVIASLTCSDVRSWLQATFNSSVILHATVTMMLFCFILYGCLDVYKS